MKFFRLFDFIIILVFLPAIQLQAESRLIASVEILNESSVPPLLLDSRQGWIPVATLDLSKAGIKTSTAILRRWRLLSRYEYDGVGGPATLQVRFRGSIAGPTFTHPWTKGTDITSEAYSNWFQEHKDNKIVPAERFYVDIRLIAPPRVPLTGRLHGIILEAWDSEEIVRENKYPSDTGIADSEVRYAYSQPLGTSPLKLLKERKPSENEALQFALDFVNSCLTGDMSSYYKAQADTVRSLDTGFAIPKYKQPVPEKIMGVSHIEEYKRRFGYKLYSATQFQELFPGWFDPARPWIPGENSYLFLGHVDRTGNKEAQGTDYLVFLIEPNENGKWKVVARPDS